MAHRPDWENNKRIFQQQAYQNILKKYFNSGNYSKALEEFQALLDEFDEYLSKSDFAVLYSRIANCAADAVLKQGVSEGQLITIFEQYLKSYLKILSEALHQDSRLGGSTIEAEKRLHEALELYIQFRGKNLKKEIIDVINQYGEINVPKWGVKLALNVLMEKLNKERINFTRTNHLEVTTCLAESYLEISESFQDEYCFARSAVMNILSDIAYFKKGEGDEEALKWIIKSLEMNPDNHFAITRRKFLEERKAVIEQIRRFQHDTAHTKAGIEGLIERCLKLPEAGKEPLKRYLKSIQAEMYHLYGVHRFIHDSEPEFETINMKKIIHDLILPFSKQKAFFELHIKDKKADIELDESYFRLAVYNLIVNSIEAFERENIALKKRLIKISFNPVNSMMTIEDNAGGISSDYRHLVFSPYISSKGYKIKTGIGLTNARKAIEKNEGRLVLPDDQPDNGTRFEIYLT